ncbi:hypothetical protein ABGB12_26905 [Actinocorallia sp. B10E7]|uniref:hypothetical protein n=1 Tax=Actinocorallia sp. B10E7 TaxID=3153558 RepID=UPI00325D9056
MGADMFVKGARLVVVGAVAAAGIAAASPAEAKATRCVLGKWSLTSYTSVARGKLQGESFNHTTHGLERTKLTITKTSISYNFDQSMRADTRGTSSAKPWQEWAEYGGKLNVKATVKGSTKGSVKVKRKTATGGGWYVQTIFIQSQKIDLGPWNLAKEHKEGAWNEVTPFSSSFTCKGKTLRMESKAGINGSSTKVTRIFTRI